MSAAVASVQQLIGSTGMLDGNSVRISKITAVYNKQIMRPIVKEILKKSVGIK